MSRAFRTGQNIATGLGNLIGGLVVAGFIVTVPLTIGYTYTSNRAIEGDSVVSGNNTPNKPLTVVNEPNRPLLDTQVSYSTLPFEVRYLEPIFYTGLLASFGLGFVTNGIVANQRKEPKRIERRDRS